MLKGSSLNNVRVNYTKGIELHQMLYIKTAFLQGYKINRETYVMPPTKANTNV